MIKCVLLAAACIFFTYVLTGQPSPVASYVTDISSAPIEAEGLMGQRADAARDLDTIPALAARPDYPEITNVQSIPEICGNKNGSMIITCQKGTAPYMYSLDGFTFQTSNEFTNIPSGDYTVQVLDDAGFITEREASVEAQGDVRISSVTATSSACFESTGIIRVDIEGGYAPILYSLNGAAQQTDDVFSNLSAGVYTLNVVDAAGCSLDTMVTVTQPGCSVYIPNIFSPNGDGINDYFQIKASDRLNVMITRFFIFDDWGNSVYKRYNLPIHSNEGWWDGTHKRFTMNPGIYSYYLEVEFDGGQRETFKGNVTLVK